MRSSSRRLSVGLSAVLCLVALSAVSPQPVLAARQTRTFTVPCNWASGDESAPEVRWSPWLPQPHVGMRLRFGFRMTSNPTVEVNCPIEVKLEYDTANAAPGKRMPVDVTLRTLACTGEDNNFESHFGLELPNRIQVGV